MSNFIRGMANTFDQNDKYFDAVIGIQNSQLEMINMIQEMHSDILQLSKSNSDIKEAIKEIQNCGRSSEIPEKSSQTQVKNVKSATVKQKPRQAVFSAASKKNHIVEKVQKSERIAKLIQQQIESNILFQSCCNEELEEINTCFRPKEYEAGSVVLFQGDIGNEFFVVEDGTLDVIVDGVSVNVIKGPSSFGELALLFGCTRQATIRAKDDCKLWAMQQQDFRAITGNYKVKSLQKKVDILKQVKIKDKVLGDVIDPFDIDAMALATKREKFSKDEVIFKESERGETLCMVEDGVVNVYNKGSRETPVATLTTGNFFGEKSLFSDDVKQETFVAKSEVTVLYLTHDDFVRLLGDNMEKLLNQTSINEVNDEEIDMDESIRQIFFGKIDQLKYEDFEILKCIGSGAFSTVKLVKVKEDRVIGKELIDYSGTKAFAMKSMDKEFLEQKGCLNYIRTEKEILSELKHPFIVQFFGEMQDAQTIYFLTETLIGGELYDLIGDEKCFSEEWSRFYSACVVSALDKMHSKKIAYRDLKPENIAIDSIGYIRIIDFGLAKKIKVGKAWTLCGTPEYLSPEVILSEGHDWGVDYWALGVLIFEMVTGKTPFHADSEIDMYKKLLAGHFILPSKFSTDLEKLLKALIHVDQSKRLGRTKGGVLSIMQSSWYSNLKWEELEAKKLRVPTLPNLRYLDNEEEVNEASSNREIVRSSMFESRTGMKSKLKACQSFDNVKTYGKNRHSNHKSILKNESFVKESKHAMAQPAQKADFSNEIVKQSRTVSFSDKEMEIDYEIDITDTNTLSENLKEKPSAVTNNFGRFDCNEILKESKHLMAQPSNEVECSNEVFKKSRQLTFCDKEIEIDGECASTETNTSLEGLQEKPVAVKNKNCKFDCNKESLVATNAQTSSSVILPSDETDKLCSESKLTPTNTNTPDYVQCEQHHSQRNKSFSKFMNMFGNLSTELRLSARSIDQTDTAEMKSNVKAKKDISINERFLKDSGNDFLRFDFVPSLELKSQEIIDKSAPENGKRPKFRNSRETILHIQRMTDTISGADFSDILSSQKMSFSKFAFVSIRPDSLLCNRIDDWGESNLSLIRYMSADICDQFPMIDKDSFTREALNAFCFPEGLKMRIIPKGALQRAETLGWLGNKSDRYQLHVFHDISGEATYGISITVSEQITVPNLSEIKLYRSKRIASIKIVKWWRTYRRRDVNDRSSFQLSLDTSVTSLTSSLARRFSRPDLDVSTSMQSLNAESLSDDYSGCSDFLQDFYGNRVVTEKSKKLAKESYRSMIENEKLGHVLIAEACYILVGTKPEAHSLLFRSLQQLINMERKEKESNTCTRRSNILKAIRKQMILNDYQEKVDYPKSEPEFLRPKEMNEIDLMVENIPSIKFSLPLPQLTSEWGVATLILRIKLPMLLILLKLILLERSVLVIGSSYEEVSSCTCALLDLLKPYKWAGTVASSEESVKNIEMDDRVREEMSLGLSVVNLNKGKVLMTQEAGITSTVKNCLSIVKLWNRSNKLSYFQERLEHLATNESSSLHSFKSFCQNGATPEERLTLHSIRGSIEKNISNLSGIVSQYADGWKSCAGLKKETKEIVYYPSKFIDQMKHQLIFQEEFFKTQMVTNHFEDRKNLYLKRTKDIEGKAAVFISDWLHFRWKFKKNSLDKNMIIALMRFKKFDKERN